MKPYTSLALIITLLGTSTPVFAADSFNPNFLISDEEMQDYKSMRTEDIQAFLTDKGGYISVLKTEDKNGVERLASRIIYEAASEHQINPKYLLVKLQKEQSLITEKDPTQKQLDGATGYGINDGCGWSCDTYLNNKGFGKQVDAAAGIMRWYYDHVSDQSWIKKPGNTYAIDKTNVVPANFATAFLYTYTPHLQGNENFWNLWQKWFDQVYPNGTLAKAVGENTVYLIQENKKRPFGSFAALSTRFDPKFILEVPASELSQFQLGDSINLPNFSILKQGDNYYLLDFDVLRKFESKQTIQQLGYHPDEIIEVSSGDIAGLAIASTVITTNTKTIEGYLLHAKEGGGYYYVKDGTYIPVIDKQIATINFPNITTKEGSVSDLQGLTRKDNMIFRDGTLMGITGYNEIYVIEHGQRRHIVSEKVFEGLGYKWSNIVWTSDIVGYMHPTGEPIYLRSTNTNDGNVLADTTTKPISETTEEGPTSTNEPTQSILPGHKDLVRTAPEDTVYIGKDISDDVETYLIADYNTETILLGKNVDVVRPMASFTKLITAYELMKKGLNLQGTVTYDTTTHKSTYHRFRTTDGEQFRNSDILDAMLVSSLNTPAKMLVSEVTADEKGFINDAITDVRTWGLSHTAMTDVYGYDLGNVTTAREYMTILKKAASNTTIKEYLSKTSYTYTELVDLDGKPDHFDTHSNTLVNKAGLPFTIIASKTGYLNEAGPGLAMIIERPSDKKRFIVITMGGHDYDRRFDPPEQLARYSIEHL